MYTLNYQSFKNIKYSEIKKLLSNLIKILICKDKGSMSCKNANNSNSNNI